MGKQNNIMDASSSYSGIVKQIADKLRDAKTQTLVGSDFLEEMYKTLNESATPILSLKKFITGAEDIAKQDATVKDVIEFCKKSIVENNIDLNFIINLCKEEHLENLRKSGHPSPEATIKEMEHDLDQPGSIIEDLIRNGIFDGLESKLLNVIKQDLGSEINVGDDNLNESQVLYYQNLMRYNPVGIFVEKGNKMHLLTEGALFEINPETKEFSLTPGDVTLNEGEQRLYNALNQLSYNPETKEFTLNEAWDFNLKLNSDGNILVASKDSETYTPMMKEHVQKLLLESIQMYQTVPGTNPNFNKQAYLHDADNFVMLSENFNKLVNVDTLEVIRNLNESDKFVMLDRIAVSNNKPAILFSSDYKQDASIRDFKELKESICETVGVNITGLFGHKIRQEHELYQKRDAQLVSLNETQKQLDKKIIEVRKLKGIADVNSPAMEKLNEQETKLNQLLEENLKNLSETQNYSIYNVSK